MKKLYALGFMFALATSTFAQRNFTPSESANKYGFTVPSKGHIWKVEDGKIRPMAEETAYDILSCKEGSVFSNEYTENTVWTGSANADAGRPDLPLEYYQHFDDCFYTFDKIRFLGFFNYYDGNDWLYCSERGGMNDEQEMTKPITFVIGVYEEDENGYPGKCVMKKDIEIIGEKTRVQIGDEVEGYTNIYEFTAELGQTIDLEHGFIQINAKDMGDSPSCWFAVFTVGGNTYAYQKDVVNEEYWGQSACAYCLYGDGSFNAKKALQIERFMTPKTSASGKYEKVQVEITNIGQNDISDAKLELYIDGKLVATEDVDVTIPSLDSYKYTFNARVDCTGGKHEVTVRNVTPGDEKKAYETITQTIETTTAEEYGELQISVPNMINITNVTLGDINNTSEGSAYSDFTDKKTTINIGQEQLLSVKIEAVDWEPSLGVFIDWNNDYTFSSDEVVEFDQYEMNDNGGNAVATISVPANATIGDHRMRVVAIPYYYTPEPEGYSYYGECEDYTITVAADPARPIMEIDKTLIDQQVNGENASADITVSNNGGGTLEANVACYYVLPDAPTSNYSSKVAPKSAFKGKFRTANRKAQKGVSPKNADETQYVLKYDGENYDVIGLGNSPTATFANLYPGKMLSNLGGMKISSVDVFIGDLPTDGTSIVIYGQKSQAECGDIITEQVFTPTEHSWNHVVLDKPVEISDKDIWVGVKMDGLTETGYVIGVDNGPAVTGFSDLVLFNGSWWSMSDLELDYNYSIRANVTGNRTPAISWLNIDKESMEMASGKNGKLNVSFAPQGMKDGLYEAYIEVSSNSQTNPFVKIPVYMVNGELTSISIAENGKPAISLKGGTLTVKGGKAISSLNVSDIAGRNVKNVAANGNEAAVDLAGLGKGVYVVTVAYADGTSTSIKVPVLK